MPQKIKTRFAPSPTGFLHVGGARTALYSWLYARHHQGEFVLRIEDTDVEREKTGAVQAILDAMRWLGMTWDEGPYYQTRRLTRYNEVIDQLLTSGKAYRCYCSKERLDMLKAEQEKNHQNFIYDRHCLGLSGGNESQPHVIRLKCPETGITGWDDLIRGRIEFNNAEFDDFIIRRTDGWPTYNFCVVVDDMDMEISHIIRAEEHINNTPKQIHVYQALNHPLPVFAHVSPILGDDNKKLSKRHGAVSVMQYQQDGFLPEALLNYLVRLGWGHQDKELFSIEEMISAFDIRHVSKSPSAFNTSKLLWLNRHYIAEYPASQLVPWVRARLKQLEVDVSRGPDIERVISLYQGRARTLEEIAQAVVSYYIPPCNNPDAEQADYNFFIIHSLRHDFAGLEEQQWNKDNIAGLLGQCVSDYETTLQVVSMPLRIFLFGSRNTPSLGECLAVLGKNETLCRMDNLLHNIHI
ncbi:glutamate--tRNA ligase [Salmonella enterica]|nr:glutamate--tRNA ligase [Salmonella enterica]